jgi:stress response protein SCP2
MAFGTPLLFTTKARHRIIVAISWDDRIAGKERILEKVRGGADQHDLDISCFVFNNRGEYIDFVGPMAQDSMDQSGAIYHSGDDATGEGGGDDEFISCELAGVPADVHSLVFVTEIRSGHTFAAVDAPSMRLADGMTNKNLYELEMTAAEGKDKEACVMARIFRDSGSPTGWKLHAIGDYPALSEVTDWGSYLTRYL